MRNVTLRLNLCFRAHSCSLDASCVLRLQRDHVHLGPPLTTFDLNPTLPDILLDVAPLPESYPAKPRFVIQEPQLDT